MSFNPDHTKQAQEVIFFAERLFRKFILKYFFSDIPVSTANSQKYLGLYLDSKLYFSIHIKTILTKVNRTIGLL